MEIINQILGWTIILGTFITYGFQYKKLYDIKNIEGINDNMLILGCTSSVFNLMGIIISNLSPNKENLNKSLYFKLLPIIQIFSPWFCLQINYLIYYIYENRNYYRKKFIFFNIAIFLLLIIIFPLITVELYNNYGILSDTLNILSAILSIMMWIPQIITTFNKKTEGSLSLISLACHACGCLLVIIFQLSEKQLFSTILPYIVALFCESWLVIYCLYQNYKIKKGPILLEDNLYNN